MDAQNNIDDFKKEVFQLISENKIPEAIGKLIKLYRTPDGTYYDDLLLLSRQYKDLSDRQLSGLVDDEDANIQKNRLTHGLINIITNLHSDPVMAKQFGLPQPEGKNNSTGTGKKRSVWIWAIPAVLLVVIAGFILSRNGNKNTQETKADLSQVEQSDNNFQKEEEKQTPAKVTRTNREADKNEAPKQPRETEKPKNTPTTDTPETYSDNSAKELTEETTPPAGPKMSTHSSRKNAKIIQAGQVTSEKLLSPNDVHYYKFSADQDGRVDINLMNLSATYSPSISVFNAGGNRLIGTRARKGDNFTSWFRAKKGEQYGIQIGIYNSDPGQYKLGLNYQ